MTSRPGTCQADVKRENKTTGELLYSSGINLCYKSGMAPSILYIYIILLLLYIFFFYNCINEIAKTVFYCYFLLFKYKNKLQNNNLKTFT